MYETAFGLTHKPFDLTSDPSYFVPTKHHNEALAALYYGVRHHKGFVVLTGEVGTGKTLLLRCLLRLVKESADVVCAYICNGRLSPTEFLQYILASFGLAGSGKNKSDLLLDLGHFLASRGSRKLTTVLIVDEAHQLSTDILEEVRLLSNLETDDDKLLQIVLVGQPELNETLDSPQLRQLKQRVAVRAHLGSLDADEVERYVQLRLQLAGGNHRPNPLFPAQTIAAVYWYSRGLPRLINTICDNALVTAYAKRIPSVTPDLIREIAKEFRLDIVHQPEDDRYDDPGAIDTQRFANRL